MNTLLTKQEIDALLSKDTNTLVDLIKSTPFSQRRATYNNAEWFFEEYYMGVPRAFYIVEKAKSLLVKYHVIVDPLLTIGCDSNFNKTQLILRTTYSRHKNFRGNLFIPKARFVVDYLDLLGRDPNLDKLANISALTGVSLEDAAAVRLAYIFVNGHNLIHLAASGWYRTKVDKSKLLLVDRIESRNF